MSTNVTRWSPAPDLLRDRFHRLFDSAFSDLLAPIQTGEEEVSTRLWAPAVDIRETDEAITLVAELPGISKEDIHITAENNVLTLKGERRFEKETKRDDYQRIERAYGAFSRSFRLPSGVRTEKIDASVEDGLLTITIPKAEETKPRQISIK